MKKILVSLSLFALFGCGSNNDSSANDTYAKREYKGQFSTLQSGGINLPAQDPTYQLPQQQVVKGEQIDIRPPVLPAAIISDSIAQFDGKRASIVYGADKKSVYNLQQIQRLLSEKETKFTVVGNIIQTDWLTIMQIGGEKNLKARYEIQEISNKEANALTVTLLEMKRDEVLFTPDYAEKQRYSSLKLNEFVGELNSLYQMQRNQLGK